MYAEGMPTLCIGLRGLIYMEVEAAGPMRDLHSGLYGGAAPNAVFGLIELLAKAKDAERRDSDSRHLRRRGRAGRGRNGKLEAACRSTRRSFWRRKSAPAQLTGEPDRIGARARLVAAHLRGARHRRRLHRGWREDRDSRARPPRR